MRDKLLYLVVICCYSINSSSDATLTPKSPKGNKEPKSDKFRLGPVNYTVFDHDLVTSAPSAKDILINNGAYFKETNQHSFDGIVLGYVTPVSCIT